MLISLRSITSFLFILDKTNVLEKSEGNVITKDLDDLEVSEGQLRVEFCSEVLASVGDDPQIKW